MKAIKNTLTGDLTIVRLTLCVLSFLLAIGFFLASEGNENYQQLYHLLDKRDWGFIFLFHTVTTFMTTIYDFPVLFKRALNLIGIWLWTYIFLSYTFYDPLPRASTEWVLAVPILLEFWLLTENLFQTDSARYSNV